MVSTVSTPPFYPHLNNATLLSEQLGNSVDTVDGPLSVLARLAHVMDESIFL
jgi:hypothetical protein